LVSSDTVSASTALAVSVLLGINQADIEGRTFNEIVDTVLPLGRTQDELVGVLQSHGVVDENDVGIHWHITDRNSDTSVTRYSRASFLHYPPTGVEEHVNAAGDGTCSTFRVVARAVNEARMAVGQSRVPFADMWDGLFDLMPVPFDIGYNFGSDYYNPLVPSTREEYDQAQTRVLTAFFLSEIRKGRIGCRCLVTGAVPMNHWPRLMERAARAANLIAMSLGYDHYDVMIPTFADTDINGITLVTPYSFTTPERTFNEFPTLDVNTIPCLVDIKNCHPAAFFYHLSLQMGSRFDAALSYVLEDLSWECRRHVADMSARHSDVGGLRQKRHVAATQDMKKETPTYPIHVNNSRQVQVSSNIRVSYPTIEFLCLSSKSNHVIADI
jgi:hypothetical protein